MTSNSFGIRILKKLSISIVRSPKYLGHISRDAIVGSLIYETYTSPGQYNIPPYPPVPCSRPILVVAVSASNEL